MNTRNAEINALSDIELDIVSGGTKQDRVEVTKEMYEAMLAIRFALERKNKQ